MDRADGTMKNVHGSSTGTSAPMVDERVVAAFMLIVRPPLVRP